MRHNENSSMTLSLPIWVVLLSVAGLSACTATPEEPKEYPSHAIEVLHEDKPDAYQTVYPDLDQDGVADRLDHCQNSRMDSKVNRLGCELDADNDGVYDKDDQCPNTPEGVRVNFMGCEPDDDRDGVANSIDECPNTPIGTKVDAKGCPLDMDLDRDGVFNDKDQCPETPLGTKVNEHGCPPEIKVLSNIVFDTGSPKIRDDQAAVLQQNASRLKDLDSDEVVLITGHTDSVGAESYNLKLSWQRADSSKEFLLKTLNLKDSDIYISGKGESSPIADNGSSEGRQQNRRIELQVIPRENLPESAADRLPSQFESMRD